MEYHEDGRSYSVIKDTWSIWYESVARPESNSLTLFVKKTTFGSRLACEGQRQAWYQLAQACWQCGIPLDLAGVCRRLSSHIFTCLYQQTHAVQSIASGLHQVLDRIVVDMSWLGGGDAKTESTAEHRGPVSPPSRILQGADDTLSGALV